MINSRNLLVAVIVTLAFFSVNAQSNLLNAKTPADIGKKSPAQLISDNDKPLAYGYVHDRDILMGKTTWEIIDLDERINFPLYYPIDTANVGKERRSLFDVLLKNIKSGKITEVYTDSYFNTKKSLKDMSSSFTYTDTLQAGIDEINNYFEDYNKGGIHRLILSGGHSLASAASCRISGPKLGGIDFCGLIFCSGATQPLDALFFGSRRRPAGWV